MFRTSGFCLDHKCDSQIVAGLQAMARNERGVRGCSEKSLGLKIFLLLGSLKGAERAERKTGWLCPNGREILREHLRGKMSFGARKFARNLREQFVPIINNTEKNSHKFLAFSVPKIPRPFLNLFSWFFHPAYPGLSCHGQFPFFMGSNRISQRIKARSATRLQHDIQ